MSEICPCRKYVHVGNIVVGNITVEKMVIGKKSRRGQKFFQMVNWCDVTEGFKLVYNWKLQKPRLRLKGKSLMRKISLEKKVTGTDSKGRKIIIPKNKLPPEP
jgi:hypothetical protein